MKNTKNSIAASLVLCIGLALVPQSGEAFTFVKNRVIESDELAEDSSYLSTAGIQAFLREKGSVLADYMTRDADGVVRSAASIIQSAATQYDLNPLFFLVMGQKESSAITSKNLTPAIEKCWLGYASCARARDFTSQLTAAAATIREGYLEDLETKGHTVSGWAVDTTKQTLDGVYVTPKNNITAALYTYNPLVGAYGGGDSRYGANSAFQKLWQEWYVPKRLYKYKSGSLLQIGDVVYLIKGNTKHPFTSRGALMANYNPENIIPVQAVVGEQYTTGTDIHFPAYSLVRAPNGAVYLLTGGKKRGFTSQEAMRQYGFNPAEIIDASWAEINPIPDGTPISASKKEVDPRGLLVQNSATGAVSYINPRGKLRPIVAKEILDNKFPGRDIQQKSPADLKKYTEAQPVFLQDGTIVTSPKAKSVYVIADNKKHPFASKKVFSAYGYKSDSIEVVPQRALNVHDDGKPIRLGKSTKSQKKKKQSKKTTKKKKSSSPSKNK